MINQLKNKVLSGHNITKKDAMNLDSYASSTDERFRELCAAANEIRLRFCGNNFDICTIINGKSGRCSEDCKYCAQSVHYPVSSEVYPLMDSASLLEGALHSENSGILRYSVVTSGKTLSDDELDKVCESYRNISKHSKIALCASHGLLSYDQFVRLKESGVVRYHNNLETSRRNFPNVCTTHTYDDKLNTIKAAQRAGLTVCSGGIFGLGETMCDRLDMAFELKALGIKSVPLNILNPIPHTPFEHHKVLTSGEVQRITALFRFILPDAALRLAGGRRLLDDMGRKVFLSGANAAITGHMLTTCGITIDSDKIMTEELGFRISMM